MKANPSAFLPVEDLAHILDHTCDLWVPVWEETRGARFFITGGTGFFGRWLLESFARANDVLALGMRAVVLTRSALRSGRDDIEFIRGDMRDFAFPPGQFDYVIHAATDPIDEEAVVAGTQRMIQFAASAGVKKFLYTSSGAVYGAQPLDLPQMSEDFPRQPITAYGRGKLRSELLCAEAGAHIARCFAFIGPHLPLDKNFAIGNFIGDARRGGPIHYLAGGDNVYRSYLYAADLAVWLWTILFRGQPGRAYNVGSPHSLSIAELAEEVATAAGCGLTITPQPEQTPNRYVPSVGRAEKELGLRVRITRDVAIAKTLAWYRQRA